MDGKTMKVLDRRSAVDDFVVEQGYRVEMKLQKEDGSLLYLYACHVGDVDSYSVAESSVMDVIDSTGEDSVPRIAEYHSFADAVNSSYGTFMKELDEYLDRVIDESF